MKKLLFIAFLTAIPLRAGALELLLEENRGESGTIGYVDIDRVFKEYSGTTGAREDFLAEIKRKEETLNAKKVPVFTLKAEIAKLRQEREFALTLPSLMETQRSVNEAAEATEEAAAAVKAAEAAQIAAAKAAEAAAAKAAEDAKAAALAAQVSTPTVQASTQTAAPLPGVLPAAAPPQVPASEAKIPSAAMSSLPGMGSIDMPGIARVPMSHFKFTVSTSVPEIDAVLSRKETELAAREDELRLFQKQTERELLEYESRRSEILLGRIYVALKELAVKEEVSVIVDKRSILYGQKAVDLTAKLLKKLEEGGI